jgi:hypothetical protein
LFKVDLEFIFFPKRIDKDDELKRGVLNWLHGKATSFYAASISSLSDEGKYVSM